MGIPAPFRIVVTVLVGGDLHSPSLFLRIGTIISHRSPMGRTSGLREFGFSGRIEARIHDQSTTGQTCVDEGRHVCAVDRVCIGLGTVPDWLHIGRNEVFGQEFILPDIVWW